MDQSYRYTRIGYPVLAWIFSLGQHQLVPVVLVVLNLFAVAAMAMLGGMFARQAGRHALWGLAFAAYFGLVISVGRDTAEPLAEACMLGGLLAYRRGGTRMYLLATALFTYGAITRETILFAPAAIAVTRLIAIARRRANPGLADLTWLIPAAGLTALLGGFESTAMHALQRQMKLERLTIVELASQPLPLFQYDPSSLAVAGSVSSTLTCCRSAALYPISHPV